jgi:hypothetical protein
MNSHGVSYDENYIKFKKKCIKIQRVYTYCDLGMRRLCVNEQRFIFPA